MTVQGGGGRKVPPGGVPTTPAASSTSTARPEKTTSSTPTKAPSTPPTAHDAFEARVTDPRLASERAALPMTEAPSTSGIDSMVRVLEDSRAQILDEHRAVREKLWRVVGDLARSGFERTLLDEKRAELVALRTRLGALRRRLQHIQRRLKTAMGKAKPADADLGKALAGQLERLQKLEPGVERAFVALSAFEQAFGGEAFAGTSLKLVDDVSAEDRGNALARAVPGAAIAVGVAHLLGTAQPETPVSSSSSSSSAPVGADPIKNLQGLADVLLQSL